MEEVAGTGDIRRRYGSLQEVLEAADPAADLAVAASVDLVVVVLEAAEQGVVGNTNLHHLHNQKFQIMCILPSVNNRMIATLGLESDLP